LLQSGDRDAVYQDYLDHLSNLGPDECRYGLYDFEFEHACEGAADTKRSKLILMIWCPDTAKIKKKMLYSSSFDALKHALEGIGKYIQATDMSEAAPECILEKIKSTARSWGINLITSISTLNLLLLYTEARGCIIPPLSSYTTLCYN